MSARISSTGLTARMLRRRPGSGAVVAILSIVAALAVVAVPVALQLLDDRVSQEALAALSPGDRDLEASAVGPPQFGPPPQGTDVDLPDELAEIWGGFDAHLEQARDGIEPPLAPQVAPAEYAVRTAAASIGGRVGADSMAYLADPRYQDHAVLTAGAWPQPFGFSFTDQGIDAPPFVEIVLSTRTADELEWAIGEERDSGVAQDYGQRTLPLKLVGTFDAAPGSDDYWYHLDSVLVPAIKYVDLQQYTTGTAFVAPQSVLSLPLGAARTIAWYPLLTAGMSADDLPEIAAQLRAFTSNPVTVGDATDQPQAITRLSFDTSAVPTLERALATQSAMAAVFAITAAGPAGAAVAVLAVACRVIARNRRPALALLAARGASSARLRALHAWHGFWYGTAPALAVGAIAIGVLVALGHAVPATALVAVLVVAALPPALLAATAPPGPRLEDEVPGEPSKAQRRRRLVVEGVVVVAALLSAAALVSATLAGDRVGTADGASASSLLVVLAPLLAALVGCVIALRVYPIPLRGLLGRLRRGAALTGFLGAARALRESAVGAAPVLALLIGVSSATMSGVLLGSIQHEIDDAARRSVGADMQIARVDLTADMLTDLAAVPGVAGVAPIGSVTRVTITGDGGDHVLATLLSVDPGEVAAVQDPVAPLVPDGADLGAAGDVPVVLGALTSSQLDGATAVTLDSTAAAVAGVSPASPPEGITDVWAVIDQSRLSDVTREAPQLRNALLDLAPTADAATVTAAVRTIVGPDATVLTADVIRDELQQRTGTNAIRLALIAASVAAALFAAIAVVLALVLAAPARDRLFGLLRALGAPSRVGRGLVWWELWPPLTASIVVGLVVGLGVAALLLATVDFGVFTDTSPAYHVDPLLLGVAILGFLAVTALFTAVALALSRRVRATSVLRQTQEG